MKKPFTVIRQGKIDEAKSILEKKTELVNCKSCDNPKLKKPEFHRIFFLVMS